MLDGEPTLKDKVIAFFKGSPKRYSFAPEMDPAARAWLREYKKLFDEVARLNAGNGAAEMLGNVVEKSDGTATKAPEKVIKRIGKIVDDSNNSPKTIKKLGKFVENAQKTPLTNMNQEDMKVSGERFAVVLEPKSGTKFVAIEPNSIEKLNAIKGDSLSAKVRNYIKQFRGTVLPLGTTDKAYIRREAEGEYTNPAKLLNVQDYIGKLNAASEFENLLSAATFLKHESDNGRHPDAVRGWNYYELKYVVPVSETEVRAYSGEIQIKLIERGDCFYDITKIKDITNGTAGQALIKAAGSVHDIFDNSISQTSQNSNPSGKISSKNVDSGERSALAHGKKVTSSEVAAVKKVISEMNIDPRGIMAVADSYFGRYEGSLTRTGLRYEFLDAARSLLSLEGDSLDVGYAKVEALADELTYNEKDVSQ